MLVPLIFASILLGTFHHSSPPTLAQSVSQPTPTAVPSATPALPTTPTPPATPVPIPTPLVLPTDAAPQIIDLRISSTVFRSGDTVSGLVITSTNVSSVELRLAGYSIPVPSSNLGVFAMTYHVPNIPFFVKHGYTLQVIAKNSKGDQTERDLQVNLQ